MDNAIKTLANCNIFEFAKQANKIRHAVSDFLKETKVLEITKNKPEIPKNATKEEERKLYNDQWKKNLSDILDACLDENVEKTVEILGLCCFTEGRENLEKLTPADLFGIALDLFSSPRVLDFFTALAKSDLINMAVTLQK